MSRMTYTLQHLEQSQTPTQATQIYAFLLVTGAANNKQAYDTLTELYRRTMTRLGGDLPQKQPSKSEISGPDVRQWAKENGISVPRTGRIPLRVENAYRAAHGLTQRASVERIFYVSNFHASASQIRDWARQNGIPVGKRGRLHPDVIRAYASASVVVTKQIEDVTPTK